VVWRVGEGRAVGMGVGVGGIRGAGVGGRGTAELFEEFGMVGGVEVEVGWVGVAGHGLGVDLGIREYVG
jgi:hypothetical protein